MIPLTQSNPIRTLSLRWQAWQARQGRPDAGDLPLRGELFNVEQLARHAAGLAESHRVTDGRGSNHLLARLEFNEEVLREFNSATLLVHPSRQITPAAEWLLDNFYLIEEQIQLARRHLPKSYSQELPRLVEGRSAGLPRVYDLMLELISHVDAQVDASSLGAFVEAYQRTSPLKLGELWAIPIMLRLGLIENLQRVTNWLNVARHDRDLADEWVDRLQEMAEKKSADLVIVVADLAKSSPPLTSPFVAEFCQRLSRKSPVLHLARNWLEQRLAERSQSVEELIHWDTQAQAADQVSVSNSITSLRFLGAMDWREFVEKLSAVQRVLEGDPAGVFLQMDFSTRDRYRHRVETLARHARLTEVGVAQRAVYLANEAMHHRGGADRTAHVGYYLVDAGQEELEDGMAVDWPWLERGERTIRRHPLAAYLGAIAGLTLAATVAFSLLAETTALAEAWVGAGAVLFFLCASQFSVSVVNWLATRLISPRLLPRLDYSAGIPPSDRTMVAIPTLLVDAGGVDHLLESLEIYQLANRDPQLHFALLTDLTDATAETMPGDEALVRQAAAGIERLNLKYPAGEGDRFFLFHRARRWNAGEERWMGFERKRGKLAEFNHVLRGGAAGAFAVTVGRPDILPAIKYVITLDTDTQLPREAARLLVGTMAHPLNRPQIDPRRGVVTTGYGILQPRVGVSVVGARRSWFARLFAGEPGIDPYTRAVSDVYQDVFAEGSFVGKGIYDVDVFEKVLGGRFPENTVLSHDLLEAAYVRSALVSDVELYEDYPFRHNVDAARRHRWTRGDWQIAGWLFSRVPGAAGETRPNPISALSQWKILDNLRRSLMPVALLAFLLGGWLLVPEHRVGVTLIALSILLLPVLLETLAAFLQKPRDLPWALHAPRVALNGARHVLQVALGVAFLPYDAHMSLDAIGRTFVRLFITRRRLLEWTTSVDAARTARTTLGGFYLHMAIEPVVALAVAFWLAPGGLVAGLLAGWWLVAPGIAWWISQPIETTTLDLADGQKRFLRRHARRIWYFFETFVTARENWLPPDNFQEVPVPVIASRTSPTNIGLALLANLAAYDLGYIPVARLLRRTEDTLATMKRLERYRGHCYNWYDTRTLEPLLPRYVSSVDSGNLLGHLLVLSAGLRTLPEARIAGTGVMAGLRDAAAILREQAGASPGLAHLEQIVATEPATLSGMGAVLRDALRQADAILASLAAPGDETKAWGRTLRQDCAAHLEDFLQLAPWSTLLPPAAVPGLEPTEKLAEIHHKLDRIPTLREVAEFGETLVPLLDRLRGETPATQADGRSWLGQVRRHVSDGSEAARRRLLELEALAQQADELTAMDFTFLADPTRHLFSIGFNVTDRRRDTAFFDLLASEARLGVYVAVAQGQVPQDFWFGMSRLLAAVDGEPILASWSGSMFEYLMPQLVMPSYPGTLLDHTSRAAVDRQIAYGRTRDIPWGISESGYNRTDLHFNYQYRAFGVPGLGLKRGLAEDLVIAPYATTLALMVSPRAACENLQRLGDEGRAGAYGFYEAVDYTPARLPPGLLSITIRSYMAHHQGMSLLALDYVLCGQPMQRRFSASPVLKSADLLLQERVPNTTASVLTDELELGRSRGATPEDDGRMRIFTNPTSRAPEIHLLSNGRYHVAITSAGGGYSRWHDLAVTRWREDATRDCWGTFLYLRDAASGEFCSGAHQPVLRAARHYEAIFTQARAEFRQRQLGLEIHTQVSISPEDDVELRRVTLRNPSSSPRTIELTTYAEVVLTAAAADAAHPAFSNLFVQTEFLRESSALLATRRARANDEKPPWLLHLLVGGASLGPVSCETDRGVFVGRGRTLAQPAAMQGTGPLSGTVGPVLDPVIALRRTVTLAPNENAVFDIIVGVTETREAALALVEKYQASRMADRAFDLAWTHSQVTLRQLDANETDAQLYARLASALIYADPARRAGAAILAANRRGQSGLWSYGISGDTPIVLLRFTDGSRLDLARQLIQAHSYWRMKGLTVELLIINEDASVYRQSLNDRLVSLVAAGIEAQMLDKPGGIFVRRLEQIPHEDRVLLQAAARIVLDDEHGSLGEQLEQRILPEAQPPAFTPVRSPAREVPPTPASRELIFDNGLGGFTRDGHEYIITLAPGRMTPAPWINVLANPHFGTVVSESGSAYTWVENAHECRLTPWHNDPVQDPTGEALYIRDDQTGQFWSPTPLPARGAGAYVTRHGFGYTVFEHTENGIASELWVYVAIDAPVKFSVLKLKNISDRPRRISVTGYWEWVLGELRPKTLLHVQTEVDRKTGALLARNYYSADFPDRIAFVDVNDVTRTLTGDRREFIGRNGGLAQPAALKRTRLSGRVGAGLDPCGALQVAFELAPGQERETSFRLGAGRSPADVQTLVQRFRGPDASRLALEGVWAYWNRTLGTVNIDTPDPTVNVMVNGWLLYQTLSSRLWGRTGFYQSGGAYGFRDQLQDVMALMHAEPTLTREHLLRAAARQFREGDVQHWWHPVAGRGVRTHFSDDFLWLPYATCRYVTALADSGVLDEKVNFLESRPVQPEEEAYYDLPARSEESATLYAHCVRAIERGLKFGAHGLPLMGCGDWNDGMNLVGREGKGESVWLAFFLYDVLTRFAGVAAARGDPAFAERCRSQAGQLQRAIEEAWDGEWYRRAYFDNGDPLGSRASPECQIDSLPQSWAVISGAGEPARSRQAMEAVLTRLVRRGEGLIQLFDPPFDHSGLNPGYIKGYIPGVRENGGQYTHGAIWTVLAFALLGEHDRAWELFDLLNPIHHGGTAEQIATYKVEPYVVAADVYAVPPHIGRGGWTWYTGSAGWMYRLLVETLLGVNREGDNLRLIPRLPSKWPTLKIHYRYRETVYHVTFVQVADEADAHLLLDGRPLTGETVPLVDDRHAHFVELAVRRRAQDISK